jgi:putative copper resistance protein D
MDPLIWMRAIHFAATITVGGAIFFGMLIAEPVFRVADHDRDVAVLVRSRLASITWIGLLAAVTSGAAWLILLATHMSGLPMKAVLWEGPLWTVLSQTDFGKVWVARSLVAGLLAGALLLPETWPRLHSQWMRALTGLLAASLVGTLAWAGHAAANFDSDVKGSVQLVGDILHLIAAAAWVGALLPLALLLGTTLRKHDQHSLEIARAATLRFSTLGMASVATLLMTGIYNSWILVGSLRGLLETDYGRLLLLKLALFLVMLSVAAVNRLRLTPRLVSEDKLFTAWDAAVRLRRNAMIEATVGAMIIFIIAVLGTMAPSADEETVADLRSAVLPHGAHGVMQSVWSASP